MNIFGTTLTAWRIKKRFTQNELAALTGISRPNISAMERGQRELTLKTLKSLATSLGITPGTLIDTIPASKAPAASRYDADALARAIASGRREQTTHDNQLADAIALLVTQKLKCHRPLALKPISRRSNKNPYYKEIIGKIYGETLVDRVLRRIDKYL